MKILKNIIAISAVTALTVISGISQNTEKTTPPTFDKNLAKKLGADERGMKMYILCILKTGPKDSEIKGKERDNIFNGHFANINRMAKDGTLAVAGPFDDEGGNWRGLYLFNVTSIAEAKRLTETDPTIKSGVLTAEYHKWYGSAAMMEVIRIHNTLIENKP